MTPAKCGLGEGTHYACECVLADLASLRRERDEWREKCRQANRQRTVIWNRSETDRGAAERLAAVEEALATEQAQHALTRRGHFNATDWVAHLLTDAAALRERLQRADFALDDFGTHHTGLPLDESIALLRTRLSQVRAEIEAKGGWRERLQRAEDALRLAEPILREAAEPHAGYGGFHGGDPRNFTPDPECSTDEEREKHRLACERWDRGEATAPEPDSHERHYNDAGEMVRHVARAGFGLGTYVIHDENAERALRAARAALSSEGAAAPTNTNAKGPPRCSTCGACIFSDPDGTKHCGCPPSWKHPTFCALCGGEIVSRDTPHRCPEKAP